MTTNPSYPPHRATYRQGAEARIAEATLAADRAADALSHGHWAEAKFEQRAALIEATLAVAEAALEAQERDEP
jgi:hypothetical protein